MTASNENQLKICFVTAECSPFVTIGGLADVSNSLAKTLSELGCDIKIFLPLYENINTEQFKLDLEEHTEYVVQTDIERVPFRVWKSKLPEAQVGVFFVDCPGRFDRAYHPTTTLRDAENFILFQHAVMQYLMCGDWSPEIIHSNDWSTSLLPVFLKTIYQNVNLFHKTKSLLTIHNIIYQGNFPKEIVKKAGLSYEHYYSGGPFEFYNNFSFLKAGIVFADAITTVSETYAKEIQTEEFGAGLAGVLANRNNNLFGILNGIDTRSFNPTIDPAITKNFDSSSLSLRLGNKIALQEKLGLPVVSGVPLLGMVSRMDGAKGVDIALDGLMMLREQLWQLVILGTGNPVIEEQAKKLQEAMPDRVRVETRFDAKLSRQIYAGSDIFLIPSRYEPCGASQMISMRYGSVPLTSDVGGFQDTVINGETGFTFKAGSFSEFVTALDKAIINFNDRENWQKIQTACMLQDHSWTVTARKYMALYDQIKTKYSQV